MRRFCGLILLLPFLLASCGDASPPATTTISSPSNGRTIYVLADALDALDAMTGAVRWSHPVQVTRSPAGFINDAHRLFLIDNAALESLDPHSGKVLWSSTAVHTPLVMMRADTNRFYVLGDGHLTGLSATTGQVVWQVATATQSFAIAPDNATLSFTTPTQLTVLDSATGNVRWQNTGDGLTNMTSTVAYAGLTLVQGIVTSTGVPTIAAFNQQNGSLLWQSGIVGPILASDTTHLYMVANLKDHSSEDVFNYDIPHNKVDWIVQQAAAADTPLFATVLSNKYFVLAVPDVVSMFDITSGGLYWHFPINPQQPLTSLTVAGNQGYVGQQNTLTGFDPDSGQIRWTLPVPTTVEATIADLGMVYLEQTGLQGGNYFVAMNGISGKTLWSRALTGNGQLQVRPDTDTGQ